MSMDNNKVQKNMKCFLRLMMDKGLNLPVPIISFLR